MMMRIPSILPCVASFLKTAALTTLLLVGCSKSPEQSPSEVSDVAVEREGSPTEAPITAASPETEPIELEPLPEPEGVEGGFSIAQVMQMAHENKLYRELYSVPADPAVVERLLTLYEKLPSQTPPKGDAEDWKERATSLVDAVKTIAGGDEAGVSAYKKSINCNSCHNRHRT